MKSASLIPGEIYLYRGHKYRFVERVPRYGSQPAANVFQCDDYVGLNGPAVKGYVTLSDRQLRDLALSQQLTRSKFRYPTPDNLNLAIHLNRPVRRPDTSRLFPWALWFMKTELIDLNRSPKTVEAVCDDLQKLISLFYSEFSDGDISNWTAAVTNKLFKSLGDYQNSSIRRIYASLTHFAGYLVRKGLITDDDDPVKRYNVPRTKPSAPQSLRAIADDGDVIIEGREVFDILVSAAQEAANMKPEGSRALPLRDLALLYVLYYTGLRASEVASLTISHFNEHPKSGGAYFDGVIGKGGGEKEPVYLQPEGLKPLLKYMRQERESLIHRTKSQNPHIFLSYRGREITRTDVYRIVERIKHSAINSEVARGSASFDIKAHPHSFRHERVYTLLKADFSESEVAREVGHKGTAQIARYSNRSKDTRAERLKKVT